MKSELPGLLAISIWCMGLLGMVVYNAETRTKEPGVWKAMGASTLKLVVPYVVGR